MSTEANAALAWPIEPTEFAYIGDQVAYDLNQLSLFDSPLDEKHYGSYLWEVGFDEAPMFILLGTTWPGKLYSYSPWAENRVSERIDREFWRIKQDAGFYMDPRNDNPISFNGEDPKWYPPLPRPCIGDPRMDPTVLEEGCIVPWLSPPFFWSIDDEETGLDGLSVRIQGEQNG